MSTVRLRCAGADTLFYEPDGLLLSAGLAPVDDQHAQHLLTFQLAYLGAGDIRVYVSTDGGPRDTGSAAENDLTFTPAELRGSGGGVQPGVWLSSTLVPDVSVQYRFTVWGEAAGDDGLRGVLVAEATGVVPLLTVTTRASVTREVAPGTGAPRAALHNGHWHR
jgi:hypothetical protein